MQMVLNGEARRARQVVKIINSDGKVVYAKPHYAKVRMIPFSNFLTYVVLGYLI